MTERCACRQRYEAAVDPVVARALSSREALFELVQDRKDVTVPTFRPACLYPCDDAKALVRLIAAQRA